MSQTLVELRQVSKFYRDGIGIKQVVRDCTLDIERGKLTVVIGPSGCGKSTLTRLIAGFERPTSGTLMSEGRPITGPHKDRLVLFQESALFPWMTTEQNVLYGPAARGEATPQAMQLAGSLIDRVGLTAFRRKYPTQLSGGMQRRAELARALVNNPKLMILDEPFRGLDAMTKSLMQEYFSGLFQEMQATVLFVTTDIDEAIFLADRLIIMTNAPTRVRKVINVDIPHPRKLADIVENDSANDVKIRALSILHEEAMRSFGGSAKASADFVQAYAARIGRTDSMTPGNPAP